MEIFSGVISEEALNNLKTLQDKNLQTIYSPAIKVYKDKVESFSFSIPLFEQENEANNVIKWINLKNNHIKTLDDQSFHQLEITASNVPYKITLKEENGKKILVYPFSSYIVHMGSGWNIEKIEIFQKTENWISFKQAYDYAIVFSLSGKREFCICTEETEKNLLKLISSNKIIEQIKSKGILSHSITKAVKV